jgi:phage shock protein PspC (stress-responsive transcriptional regulator)
MKELMKSKLTSRKFWAAVAGVVMGLATIFGLDEGVISTIAGSIVTGASVVAYILAEGSVDKARMNNESLVNTIKGSTTETEFNDNGEVTKTTTYYE